MSGRIPDQFIQDLLNRIDISEVIGERIPLRAAGTGLFKASCPFHNEKTPSFTVSIPRQTYHCFGCGAHGTAIGFLMEYDHLDFPEAIEELAQRIGETVPRESWGHTPRRARVKTADSDYTLLLNVAKRFSHWLRRHPESQAAINYLKERGLSGEVAKQYQLGYAPSGWNSLRDALGKEHQEALIRNGLLIRKEDSRPERVYDRFRERIIFPIRDRRGRVIGFGGRVFNDSQPKYLNSPETPIFTKGSELYGLYEALRSERHPPYLIVVEGYMDVIALAQAGITSVVATLGTAITASHIDRLLKTTSRVLFCFDGDTAGREAAWKALNISLEAIQGDHQIQFLFLPDGEDPDSMVRRLGAKAFEALIDEADSLSSYMISYLGESLNLSTLDGLSTLVERVRPLAQLMAPSALRRALVHELAEVTRFKFGQANELETLLIDAKSAPPPATKTASTRQRTPIRLAIALLLEQPQLAHLVENPKRLKQLDLPGAELLAEMISFLHKQPDATTAILLETWHNQSERDIFQKLITWNHLVPEEGVENEFRGIIARFEALLIEQEIHALEDRMREERLSPEEMARWKALIRYKVEKVDES